MLILEDSCLCRQW